MSGKWLSIKSPTMPAVEFAAEALCLRVQYVEQMLPLAALHYREDIEHVHRLRVACRRADAASTAFRPLLPSPPKALRKWLKQIRRTAGPARDLDVLTIRLEQEATTTPADPQLDYIIGRLQESRTHTQEALVATAEQALSGKLTRSLEKCIRALDAPPREFQPVKQFARAALRSASQAMFRCAELDEPALSAAALPMNQEHPTAAGHSARQTPAEGARSPQTSITQLHQIRIAGKRLRYSIELFSSVFPAALREEVYPQLEKIQARLGNLNDCATAQALFQSWLVNMPADDRAASLAQRIVQQHDASLAARKDFLKWWTPKRIAKIESHLQELCYD